MQMLVRKNRSRELPNERMEAAMRVGIEIFLPNSASLVLGLLSVLALAAQAWAQTPANVPIPEYYGVYAVENGKLLNVSGQPSTSTFTPNTVGITVFSGVPRFFAETANEGKLEQVRIPQLLKDLRIVVYHQPAGLASPMMVAGDLRLIRFVYVRNVLQISGDKPAVRRSRGLNAWHRPGVATSEAGLSKVTGFLVRPIPGHPDMVLATPEENLSPGLYELEALHSSDIDFRFLVGQPVDSATQNCLDLSYLDTWQQFKFTPTPCVGSDTPIAPKSVEPSLASPTSQPTESAQLPSSVVGSPATVQPSISSPSTARGPTAAQSALLNTAEWDKILSLGQSVAYTMCREKSFDNCEPGTFAMGRQQISFAWRNVSWKNLFAVPPVQVTVLGVSSHASVRLRIGTKNYSFDYFPTGVTCDSDLTIFLKCPAEGVSQQLVVANYIAQTIPKLALETLGPASEQASAPASTSSVATATGQKKQSSLGTDNTDIQAMAERIRGLVSNYERAGAFRSPLDDEQFLERILGEAKQAGVPP